MSWKFVVALTTKTRRYLSIYFLYLLGHLHFFFLPFLLKSFNLNLIFFTLLLFLIWLSNYFQKYITLSWL